MALIERVKKILLDPKSEWLVINEENETPQSLLGKYVIPLLFLSAIAAFIGYGWIGLNAGFFKIKGIKWGLSFAISQFLSGVLGYYIATYVIDALANSFSSEKNLGKSAQLVAYSMTASWVASLFMVIPALGVLSVLGLYGIYLFYTGLPILKKTPEDKRIPYMLVSALVIIVISIVVQYVVSHVLYSVVGNPYESQDLKELQDLFKK